MKLPVRRLSQAVSTFREAKQLPRLNPEKHIHNQDWINEHQSWLWFGRIFEVKRRAQRGADPDVKQQVIECLFGTFVRKDLTFEGYEAVKERSWMVYDVNIEPSFDQLMQKLSSQVVVRRSALRPALEQSIRLLATRGKLTAAAFKSRTIDEFVEAYCQVTEALVEEFDEEAPRNFLTEEESAFLDGLTPRKSTLHIPPERMTLVNRLMAFIH